MKKIIFMFLMVFVTISCSVMIPSAMVQNVVKQVGLGPLPELAAIKPAASIVQLADAAGMTARARAIFFAASPEIDPDHQVFDQHCQTQAVQNTAELGCYTTDHRIFILNIPDKTLSSEMAVVAAHEMLHAAYDQLSRSQQSKVNALVANQVRQIHNADLSQRLKVYSVMEPGQRSNELHSILGTEFSGLSPALEQYYSQYFTNRSQVVSSSQHFDAVFASLEKTLSSLEQNIVQVRRQMQVDRVRENIPAYNRLVPQLNSLVDQYNQAAYTYDSLSAGLVNGPAGLFGGQ
jgi:hypothetical protein